MKVRLKARLVTLDESARVGVGGEATVYRLGSEAVKIFHPIEASLPAKERKKALSLRAEKIEKLRTFPRPVPAQLVAPKELVETPAGEVIGYAMDLVQGAEELTKLSRRAYREGSVSNGRLNAIFLGIHRTLREIHAARIVAGDLNEGNILFRGAEAWFIDADSMQFGAYPCTVAHEHFLDPRFYGVDLASAKVLDEASDWYAFAVLYFNALVFMHPFGGTHPTLGTLLRRAEARHSVLRPDVKRPKCAVDVRVLGPELLDFFGSVFDGGLRQSFPQRLLRLPWQRCGCGLEYASASCPVCASQRALLGSKMIRRSGRCRGETVFSTHGRILATRAGRALEVLFEENGGLWREGRTRLLDGPLPPSTVAFVAGARTWIGLGDELLVFEGARLVTRRELGTGAGQPSFGASALGAFVGQSEWLVDAGTEQRLGQILEGGTWIAVGERFGFGFYRVGQSFFAFTFRPERPGLLFVALPPLRGRIVDVHAVFDEAHVLFSIVMDQDGRRFQSSHLFDEQGHAIARLEGVVGEDRRLPSPRASILSGGRVLTITDAGLLLLSPDRTTGLLAETALFPETESFLEGATGLLTGPEGSVHVVSPRMITRLTLSAQDTKEDAS